MSNTGVARASAVAACDGSMRRADSHCSCEEEGRTDQAQVLEVEDCQVSLDTSEPEFQQHLGVEETAEPTAEFWRLQSVAWKDGMLSFDLPLSFIGTVQEVEGRIYRCESQIKHHARVRVCQ
ncbi:uncharacterized protein LOC119951320 isoform X3 [Scyliorhinus canicula]|uniref:uncharacterized protein LOC119951320 isoform X3 n=1 Tax=Scyliorhinus canicula TaxID=7830 RepID=UPI0018F3099B|nr:uncharacterized protein LOC119951320 isoform X3 [Scyliorhinus canicula]